MRVIPFPQWRIFSYVDDRGQNIIRHWLNELEATDADRWTFQALLDICEYRTGRVIQLHPRTRDWFLCVDE